MKSKYAGSCPKCSKAFVIDDEIFISKVGESWIKCIDKACFESQGGKVFEGKKGFQVNKHSITEAEAIYNKAEGILDSFMQKRLKDGLHHVRPQDGKLEGFTINEESIFILSMFRTLSGNFKP